MVEERKQQHDKTMI